VEARRLAHGCDLQPPLTPDAESPLELACRIKTWNIRLRSLDTLEIESETGRHNLPAPRQHQNHDDPYGNQSSSSRTPTQRQTNDDDHHTKADSGSLSPDRLQTSTHGDDTPTRPQRPGRAIKGSFAAKFGVFHNIRENKVLFGSTYTILPKPTQRRGCFRADLEQNLLSETAMPGHRTCCSRMLQPDDMCVAEWLRMASVAHYYMG
jgi:hypothetical protein